MIDPQAVIEAAAWLSAQMEPPPNVVRVMKDRFGLSAKEACLAIARARGLTGEARTYAAR